MTREDYIIKMRRAAREKIGGRNEQTGRKSLSSVLAVQILVCVIAYGAFMGTRHIENVKNCVEYYLNYTVDCRESVDGIIKACRSLLFTGEDA